MIRDVERARDILRRRKMGQIYKVIGEVHNIGPVRVRSIHLELERMRNSLMRRALPHEDEDVLSAFERYNTRKQEEKS